MIRYQLIAHKQAFVVLLFLVSVALMLGLKYVVNASGLILLIQDSSVEVYLIGVAAALIFMRKQWDELIRGSVVRAPFQGVILALRFSFIQSLAFAIIYFLLRDVATSRSFLIWFLVVGLPVNSLLITWLPFWLRRFLLRSADVRGLLIGKGPIPEEVWRYIERSGHFGVNFQDYYGDVQDDGRKLNRLGDVADFSGQAFASEQPVGQVLFFGNCSEDADSQSALSTCYQHGVRLQVMLHGKVLSGLMLRHVVDGEAHLLTSVVEPLQNPLNRIAKRLVDIAISLFVVLVIFPPLCIFVWVVQQRQSTGTLFYRQTRHGMGRSTFSILKFRSMSTSNDAESRQATVGDPRVFPFGRIMRHFSLDEVPQFLNVLRGEMSVIGPRPHLAEHDDLFEREINAYRIRHFVKPGITGYAQIRGFRGEVTSPEQIHQRVQYDIYYIANWSMKLDFYIACKTIAVLIRPPKSAV